MTHRPHSRFDLPRHRRTPADDIARRLDREQSRDIARLYGGTRVWL